MKKLLLCLFLCLPSILFAQHSAGAFETSNYVLMGETEIVLKDGQKRLCNDNINGTKIGDTGIDYKDVDYIRLIKTKLKDYYSKSRNGSMFKYIIVNKKPKFVKVIVERPNLSFYGERPKSKGKDFFEVANVFMIKDGADEAEKVNFGNKYKNVSKIFSDCPKFAEYKKDKKARENLDLFQISYIYEQNCGKSH